MNPTISTAKSQQRLESESVIAILIMRETMRKIFLKQVQVNINPVSLR